MSFIWRLFSSEKPPDDETVLAALERDIQRRQTLLTEIRARERTATALVTLYTLAAWLVYVGVWYFGFVSGGGGRKGARVGSLEKAVKALPVVVGPILILFIRRIVQIWYARKGNAEEKTLQTLLKTQRAKVEEIKKKTNFYQTHALLSRYDLSSGGPSGGPNATNANGGGPGSVSSPNTPQRGPGSVVQGTPARPGGKGPRPSTLVAGASPPPPPQQPQQPRGRGWFDALADVLVGPDDSPQIDKEKQKFALICEKCFAHNGLVPESVWGDARESFIPVLFCVFCVVEHVEEEIGTPKGASIFPVHKNTPAQNADTLTRLHGVAVCWAGAVRRVQVGRGRAQRGAAGAAGSRNAGLQPTSPTSPVSAVSVPLVPIPTAPASRPGGADVPLRRRSARGGDADGEEMEVDS
ncbi:hypothetical protein MVEN_00738200 [Mycena venus]|uniref:Endoplasmic reticulum junction formation protein lunapark n=1 Tax=Mycena venus TaxID=2733690 RepID=A0A8H6YHX4_9AGAR|nr:hypothetical protein MVEN_00738200 [Mycena venus]